MSGNILPEIAAHFKIAEYAIPSFAAETFKEPQNTVAWMEKAIRAGDIPGLVMRLYEKAKQEKAAQVKQS
jgi:hypothetical protein